MATWHGLAHSAAIELDITLRHCNSIAYARYLGSDSALPIAWTATSDHHKRFHCDSVLVWAALALRNSTCCCNTTGAMPASVEENPRGRSDGGDFQNVVPKSKSFSRLVSRKDGTHGVQFPRIFSKIGRKQWEADSDLPKNDGRSGNHVRVTS